MISFSLCNIRLTERGKRLQIAQIMHRNLQDYKDKCLSEPDEIILREEEDFWCSRAYLLPRNLDK